jgi:hypothetical protein
MSGTGRAAVKVTKFGFPIAAAAMMVAQPCLAAEDFRDGRTIDVRTGAFAGVNLRLPFDGRSSRRPTARLQFTGVREVREANGATHSFRAEGVQIGTGRDGRLALTIAGQNPLRTRDQLGMSSSTGNVLLIVGGVLLIVVVLAAVAGAMPTPGPHEGDFD